MDQFVGAASLVVGPSKYALDLITELLPSANSRPKSVIPYSPPRFPQTPPKREVTNRILVLGDIGFHKGSLLLRRLAPRLREANYEVHVLGRIPASLEGAVAFHGPYEEVDIAKKIGRISADLAIIPSIFPETYSFVLTELMWSGQVVLASKIGALTERIEESGVGLLVEDFKNVDAWYASIIKAFEANWLVEQRSLLGKWQEDQMNYRERNHRLFLQSWSRSLD